MNDPLKPREELDSHKFYPDLHDEDLLPVFVTDSTQPSHRKVYKPSNLNKPNYKQIPKEILPTENIKIPSKVMKLGYKLNNEINKNSTYIRENDYLLSRDINILNDISQNQIMFKSLYDMDEQDNYLLSYLKDQGFSISNEIFECCLTILENEWNQLELKIPPKLRSSTLNQSNLKNFINLYGSDDGIGINDSIDDQNCSICNESECDNSNAIIFCDGCDIAVHQDCYGVLFIPEGQWLCRRCMLNKNKKITCQFCPSKTGAFKQTANGLWSHVLCGLWIPELYFASINHMEPIEGIELIPKGRWKLNCYICKKKCGACIQCANKNCFTAFHVTCAKRAGLYMKMKKGIQNAVLDKSSLVCYCDKHSPRELLPSIKQGIIKTRLYFDYLNNLNLNFNYKANHITKKWKTSKGTPIGPNFFIKILNSFLIKFKINNSTELSQILTKYWSMKREMKKGAPLIRRVNMNNSISNDLNEIKLKLDFSKILLKDLKNLNNLNNLIVKREELKLKKFQALNNAIELNYFNQFELIKTLINKILNLQSSKFLLNLPVNLNLNSIVKKFKNFNYLKIDDFLLDLFDFFKLIENRNILIEIKSKNRILREIESDLSNLKKYNNIFNSNILSDFKINGLIFESNYNGKSVLEEEGLSDVE